MSLNRPVFGLNKSSPQQPQITHEQIKAIIATAQELKRKGATEETDPEFARLVSLLRYYNQYSKKPASSPPPRTENTQKDEVFNQSQLSALRYQIVAYKLLASNKALPDNLKHILFQSEEPIVADSVPTKITDSTYINEKQESNADNKTLINGVYFGPESDPYGILAKAKPGSSEIKQRLIIPSIMPQAPDPENLRKERDQFIHSRIQYRIKELESLPSNITNNGNMKLRALIELKSLRLAEKQRRLRYEIVQSISKSTTLDTAVDRSSFRRMKRQSLREARLTEKQERSNRAERDKKERQKHLDYLSYVLTHGRDMTQFHRQALSKAARLGSNIVKFHINAAKEEERKAQKNAEDRLKALKENDEEAYMKLIDKTKDKRITHLLSQTDSFLKSLTNAVGAQKKSVVEETVVADSGEPKDEDSMIQDYYNTAHSVKEVITEQPSILVGGTLKEYQIKGLQWMVSLYNNRLNGILADEMGLGKTIQTLSLITYLIEKKRQPGPFLVIVPLSTITNWVLEFEKWAPSVTKIVYKGGPAERKNLSSLVRAGNFNCVLTTYEYIIRDRPVLSKVKWVHMIIDEGHRMKNNNSKLSVTLMQYYHTRYRIILTGTPLQNNLPELWALLNFILPKIFNSVKTFDEWFNTPFTRETGQEKIDLNEEEQILIIRRLHKVLRPFLLRRLKKDVEKDLPDKVQTVIKCPMSALQLRLYEQVRTRKSHFGGAEGNARKRVLNNLVMQFRKICNHPYVFGEVEDAINPSRITDQNLFRVAGKFELLDRILPKLKATGHRVLMFFQMTQIMNIMEDYLRWKNLTFLRLDGSTKAEDRTAMLGVFNGKEDPPFVFLLSTRAGGLGLNLQVADTVIIFDSDWNPHQDLQAQDRAHRIGQTKEVRILRLITSKSIEEAILARAQYKLDIDGKVIQAGKFDNKTSDTERDVLLRALLGNDDDDDKDDDKEGNELDETELNEIIARDENELQIFNKMDADRRVAEETAWKNSGQKGPVQARLMQDDELPQLYLVDPDAEEEEQIPIELGRGNRQRKQVVYDDGLNDNQFSEAINEGDLDGFIEKKRKKKERRESSNLVLEESYESLPESASEMSSTLSKSKRRTSKKVKSGEDLSSEIADDSGAKLKSERKEIFAGVNPDEQDTIEPSLRQALNRVFSKCFKEVEKLETDAEGYSRNQSELFLSLPDRVDYSDYYKIIKMPIAMDMIQHRMKHSYYKSLEEFTADFKLMFDNAMTYNQEGSQVYTDAQALKNAFYSKLGELCPNSQVEITDQDRENAAYKSSGRKRNREETEGDGNGIKIKISMGKRSKVDED